MAFSATIAHVSSFQAQCSELGCSWIGPLRSHHRQAEADADKHINLHYEQWDKYQKAIERAGEILDEHNLHLVVEYHDDLTIPTEPGCSSPYTGDRLRFDYSRHFDELVEETHE